MLISGKTNMAKVVIIALVFLAASLAANAWAKSDKSSGRSERSSRDSSSAQRSERSSARERSVSSAPRERQTVRETPRTQAPAQQRINREPQQVAPQARQFETPRAVNESDPVRNPAVRPQRRDNDNIAVNREQQANIGTESFRQRPENVIQPLSRTTQVRRDDSRSDTPAVKTPVNRDSSERPDRILRNQRDNDGFRQDRTPVKDRVESPTPQQRRDFNRDRPGSRDSTVRNNDSGKSDFVRSRRNKLEYRQERDDMIRVQHTSVRKGVVYEDRTRRHDRHHYQHVFRDRHSRLIYSVIWPSFYYPVCYDWGHHYSVRYFYPYYHRRFVFVSLGGFWPEYSYVRYYWYPSHYYTWYGYDPVAQEVSNDTYNYYTYNYYDTQPDSTGIASVDETTFADVREKLAQQKAAEPAAQTDADTLFDDGVKAFEGGSYAAAEEKFARAMAISPDDMILPFAYAQALMAQGKYFESADILRVVVQKSTPDKQGVFFPRGLYTDENILDEQIDRLTIEAAKNPADTDMQLLLGYQLLGIGETEKAIDPLNKANLDNRNFATVNVLLDLAEKIQAGAAK